MKNVLIFDPDWYFIEEQEIKTLFQQIDKPDIIIYYDPDIPELANKYWADEVNSIYFLDILKETGTVEYLSKLPWVIARSMPHYFESLHAQFTCESVRYFKVDELFLGSQLSRIIRNILIFDYLRTRYDASEVTLNLIAYNDRYTEFIMKQSKYNNISVSIIQSKHPDNNNQRQKIYNYFLKVKNIFNNSIRYFAYKKNIFSTHSLYAIAHRDTLPIINYLMDKKEYEIVVEDNSDQEKRNVIAPNIIVLFYMLIERFKYFFQKSRINEKRSKYLDGMNDIFKKHLSCDINNYKNEINTFYDQIILRVSFFRTKTLYYKAVLERVEPDILLHCNYVSLEQRIVFNLCKQYGIISLSTQHGLMNPLRLSSDVIYSDYLCVWGNEAFVSYNDLHPKLNSGQLIITGKPILNV